MTKTHLALALVAALTAASPAAAGELVATDTFGLDAHGRLQWLAVGQSLDDDFRNDQRLYLFMKQARVRLNGRYEETKFDIQWAYGGEDIVAANPGVALSLLDFSFDVPLVAGTRLKVGQFRVPYGRERLTDSGTLNFADRSIQALGFNWNRDVGAAVHTVRGKFTGTAGVFTGGGRDVPQRYLPEIIGSPMLVARVGYNDGVDESAYEVAERGPRPGRATRAVYANALYVKDSLIGHSTVLNVRSTDKSLLVNANWNPFIAQAPLLRGTIWQAGGDAVIRKPVGATTVNAAVEVNYARFTNQYGRLDLKGGRVQVGAARGPVELNVRYAALYPDTAMANTFTVAGSATPQHSRLVESDKPMREITPSIAWAWRRNVTLVADLPVLLDMLVFKENRLGTYVASEQPDQTTVVKPGAGSVERQTVIEGRLLVQFTF